MTALLHLAKVWKVIEKQTIMRGRDEEIERGGKNEEIRVGVTG